MADKHYVTWDEIKGFIEKVAERYKYEKITGIYGIPRGGIILATMLSYKMDIPMVLAPCRGCIIIDDISDTGETLLHYDRNTSAGGEKKGYHIVKMFYREASLVKPEFYTHLKTNEWIVYPWEE